MQTQYQLILHNQTPLLFYLLCLIRSFIPCALFNIHCNTLSIPLINNAFRWSRTIYCLITSTQATLIQMPADIYSITPLPCSHAPLSLTNLHLFCLLVITTKAGGPLWSECLPTTTIKSVNPESTCPFTHQRQASVWSPCTFFVSEFAGWKLTLVCCLLRCFCELMLQKPFFSPSLLRDCTRSLATPAYPVISQNNDLKREQKGYIVTKGVLEQKAPLWREKSFYIIILCEGEVIDWLFST